MSLNIGSGRLRQARSHLSIIEEISEHRHMRRAARRHPAIFRQMPTDRIDELGPLAHRQIARADHQPRRLLLLALHRHEAHAGRCAASQIASASTASFLLRFTKGSTYAGGISRTSCPIA
jgi:hypothetical protein